MTGVVILAGMIVGVGLFLIVRGSITQPLRLDDALAILEHRPLAATWGEDPPSDGHKGRHLHQRLRLPLSEPQQRLLAIQGRTVSDFFAEKLIWTVAGVLLPAVWAAVQLVFGFSPGLLPVAASLAGGIGGYFIADIRLRKGAEQHRRSAVDGMHTFFDLVVLERLANASAAQATAAAAAVADSPLFRRIASGVERARMEQVQPWDELRRIAQEWDVPELTDFADVMQLEEQGAGLAEVLQARVRELRDAHLSRQKAEAQEASEAMTLWMTLPSLLLGVALLTPALLTLVGGW